MASVNEPSVFEPMKFHCITFRNLSKFDYFHRKTEKEKKTSPKNISQILIHLM